MILSARCSPSRLPTCINTRPILHCGYEVENVTHRVQMETPWYVLGSRKLARRMVEELVIVRAVNLDEKGRKRIQKVVGKVTWDHNDVEWEEDDDDEGSLQYSLVS